MEAHQAGLVRLAYALCGDWDGAEDCVASVFARVWPRWSRGRVVVDRYLRRAVINEVASWHRWRFRELRRLACLRTVEDYVTTFEQRNAEADAIRRHC